MKQPKPIQISIPQPCSEDWNKMTPQGQGRFCDSCQKCVVDFTGFTDELLYKFFVEHRGQKVCGKFQKWQLNRLVALPLKPRNRFYKWFISLGFVIFLSELLGNEARAQEPVTSYAHNKQNKKPKPGIVLGSITDPSGNPIEHARVTISKNDGSICETFTNNEGNYIFKKITAGYHDLTVYTENYKKHAVKNIVVQSKRHTGVNAVLTRPQNEQDSVNYIEYTSPVIDVFGGVFITDTTTNKSENSTIMTGNAEIEPMPAKGQHTIDSVIKNFQPVQNQQK